MKNTITTIFALALSTSAYAADMPSGKAAPVAPTAAVSSTNTYVGVNIGADVTDGVNKQAPTAFGAVLGRKVVSFGSIGISGEAAYDYTKGGGKLATGNLITSYSFGPFSPYALGGVGYRWAALPGVKDEYIWNVGGGIKFAVTSAIDLDARYRHVENFDYKRPEDRVSVGVNYKF